MNTDPAQTRALIQAAASVVKPAFGEPRPDLAVILGSGLGAFVKELADAKTLPYSEIPGFPKPTVPGHTGELVCGTIGKHRVLVFRGRFHFYEGHSLPINTLPVRVAGELKIRTLVVTNAAGAIRKDLHPGGILLIRDHVNLMGRNPLFGPNLEEFGPRFVDMTTAYDEAFRVHAKTVARKLHIPLPEGVYGTLSGPSYETPAEIRMLATLGVDVVGMSTVPEVIVARHQGMRVLGLSLITNFAAGVKGLASEPITHQEVLDNTRRTEKDFRNLLRDWIATYENHA